MEHTWAWRAPGWSLQKGAPERRGSANCVPFSQSPLLASCPLSRPPPPQHPHPPPPPHTHTNTHTHTFPGKQELVQIGPKKWSTSLPWELSLHTGSCPASLRPSSRSGGLQIWVTLSWAPASQNPPPGPSEIATAVAQNWGPKAEHQRIFTQALQGAWRTTVLRQPHLLAAPSSGETARAPWAEIAGQAPLKPGAEDSKPEAVPSSIHPTPKIRTHLSPAPSHVLPAVLKAGFGFTQRSIPPLLLLFMPNICTGQESSWGGAWGRDSVR
uniref:WRKY domain-containing protein n=1 Tax=Mycoplasma suis TaxID=57372 RepID=Q8KM86_9MOLU|nr:hypothetical protein [Mycoplasma suis]